MTDEAGVREPALRGYPTVRVDFEMKGTSVTYFLNDYTYDSMTLESASETAP